MLTNLCHVVSLTLIAQPDKMYKKRKLYTSTTHKKDPKVLNKILEIQIKQRIKRIIYHAQVELIPSM
jgi:hypothetical protein